MAARKSKERPAPFRALGNRFASLRSERRISQRELSRAIGQSDGYMGRIETGENRPSTQALEKLANELGADYSELAQLAGYARPDPDVEAVRQDWLHWSERFEEMVREGREIMAKALSRHQP